MTHSERTRLILSNNQQQQQMQIIEHKDVSIDYIARANPFGGAQSYTAKDRVILSDYCPDHNGNARYAVAVHTLHRVANPQLFAADEIVFHAPSPKERRIFSDWEEARAMFDHIGSRSVRISEPHNVFERVDYGLI